MEKIDERVEEYYKKLEEFNSWHAAIYQVKASCNELHQFFRQIIELNRDYLFTDSLLDYCTSYMGLHDRIRNYTRSDDHVKYEYMHYLSEMIDQCNEEEMYHRTYFKLLDPEMLEAVKKVSDRVKKMYEDYDEIHNYLGDIKRIYELILYYYAINGRKDNIDEMCDIFSEDAYKLLDTFYFMGFRNDAYGYINNKDAFDEYIISEIEKAKVKQAV